MRVLLVEDCDDDAVLTTDMLVQAGLERALVVRAFSVGDARRCVRESDFDVIALDLHLPDSRGAESVSRLIQEGNDTPIVVLSGSGEAQTVLAAIRSGARDYLIKGKYDAERLIDVLRKAAEWGVQVGKLKRSLSK